MKLESGKRKRTEKFTVGDKVLCTDHRNPNKKTWVKAVIDEVLSDRIYLCKTKTEGAVWKRDIDQILRDNSEGSDMVNGLTIDNPGESKSNNILNTRVYSK